MAKQTIDIGSNANDGTGSTIRAGGDLINDNFNEIYTELGNGSALAIASKTQTLTNKTINGPDNTLTNIANASLANSNVTIGSTAVALGATATTFSGITSLQTETLTNASGNLLVTSATNITEFRGNGSSVEGQIKLNCHANTHGQTIKPQPHSAGITNTMLLPTGANSTLVSLVSADTLTNKTIGVTQLVGNTRTATGDGSDTTFTVTSGATVNNTLVFVNGALSTDYTISGTTLTFGSAPTNSHAIVIKEL